MFEMLLLFASALALGLFFCALPDAVNTEAVRRGIKGGFRSAFFFELGSCIGDLAWAILAMIGLEFMATNSGFRVGLGLLGTLLLFFLAYRTFRDALHLEMNRAAICREGSEFMTGALVSLTNPVYLAFWLGIGGSYIALVTPNPVLLDLVVFLSGYMSGSVIWCFLFSGMVAYGRRYLSQHLFRTVYLVCGALLVFFGTVLLWDTLIG
jgi:chemosensory pili system protein ChpE